MTTSCSFVFLYSQNMNNTLTGLFLVEMLMKWLGKGFVQYWYTTIQYHINIVFNTAVLYLYCTIITYDLSIR